MYIAMAKEERVNIRIVSDVKLGGNIVAEMESRTLSSLITDLLRKQMETALKQAPVLYEEAAKRFAAKQRESEAKKKKRKPKTKETPRPVSRSRPDRPEQRASGNSRTR